MPTYSILIVEDNTLNQKLMMTMLGRQGHTLTLAENGAEAIDYLTQRKFDIVLMDLQMPVMTGNHAIKLIRGRKSKVLQPEIPVIALSAFDHRCGTTQEVSTEFSAWLKKPFDITELENTITSLLTP